jgi:hypothetical protein
MIKNRNASLHLDHHIRKSATIERILVECKRNDSSMFIYFKGEFDIIVTGDTSEKKENSIGIM